MIRVLCALLALALASCAGEAIIHERTTAFGRILVTEDHSGLRTLRFSPNGSRQSVVRPGDPQHLELPYARMALAGLVLCGEPRRILVLGLGGASLPGFLRHYYPDAAIDIAEINPEIVEVAKQYFGFREDPRMRVHVQDGRKFIESLNAPAFDAIFLDAFGDRSVPPHLATREFLLAVRRAVVPSGVVIGNLWNRHNNPLYDDMVGTYRDVFDEVAVLVVDNDINVVLLALARPEPVSRSELARRARQLSAEKKFRFNLGALVEAGWQSIDESRPASAGRVLRD